MFQDYAREVVPNTKSVTGWHIGLIYIGVGLTLPAFLTGAMVGQNLGFWHGILATLVAGLILSISGMLTGWVGGRVKLSTYYICQMAFGGMIGKLISLLLTLTVFGWFGVTVNFFAQAVESVIDLPFMTETLWSGLGGFLMMTTAIWGFKGLKKFTLIAVPLIIFMLIYVAYQSVLLPTANSLFSFAGTQEQSFGAIVSILVGGWMVGVSLLPDLSRYAKTPAAGSFGGFLCFLPGLFLIMGLSMIPSISTGESDIIKTMLTLGVPTLTALTIILASWSSNDNNLYAASLGLASIIPSVPKWVITLVAGIIGTVLGMLGILDKFITFLVFLGVFIPPVAGAYIMDYMLNQNNYTLKHLSRMPNIYWSVTLGWGVGSAVAYMATPLSNGGLGLLSLSTIPALDGGISAALVVLLIQKISGRKF